ncbi:MAG: glycosyltransferase family 4 protein [Candidatus Woesearchaeota archaeon]
MKILIITEYFPESKKGDISGGVESRAFYIASELAKENDVTVICGRTGNSKAKDNFFGIKIIRPVVHKYSHNASFFLRLRFAIKAYNTAKEMKADIVDGYNFISYLPAYFAAKKIGAKKIATYHETWVGEWIKNKGLITGIFGSLWERFVLGLKWDKIISVSEFTKKKLVEAGVPEKKIVVIPNGVKLSLYNKIKTKKSKNPTICCISRLVKTKRVDDLIKAISIVKKDIPNVECKVIGVGEERKNLEKLASRIGVAENVKFLGRLRKHSDVIKVIKSSHLLCHPSVIEGFGIVIIEAMASGVPYICSNITPLIEITHEGKGGLIFEQKNYVDLASKTLLMLKNKELYNQKIKEGIKLAENYSWENIARKVENAYKQ